ncbi:putative F-box protein PP2-B12 [Pistacia vera]|uniref:putative F-box protein PP2-B12 n=1 Tax=Pistacia vera TaxID=55513 RepID=UPI00126305D9|nr:putative F-box protein PP2-B12 [Pistacia vera]XP_031270016.1 putative F-box protein PP2-B12 [Pistacia vera]
MENTSVDVLPVDCLSKIISLTSPRDACRLSAVSRLFNSAADSEVVWDTFLPSDYKDIVCNSASSELLATCSSKKNLYFHLCRNPIILNNGTMSFSLEKESGKKCYMVAARQLVIRWLCREKPQWWKWQSLHESRFDEVVELLMHVWWLDVKGRIETKILSPRTTYAAYFVFKLSKSGNEYERIALQFGVYFEGRDNGKRRVMFLNPSTNASQLCRDRGDGWMEIEMSEFFNVNGDEGTLLFRVFDFHGFCTKHGLIIEGIELRPKNGR